MIFHLATPPYQYFEPKYRSRTTFTKTKRTCPQFCLELFVDVNINPRGQGGHPGGSRTYSVREKHKYFIKPMLSRLGPSHRRKKYEDSESSHCLSSYRIQVWSVPKLNGIETPGISVSRALSLSLYMYIYTHIYI